MEYSKHELGTINMLYSPKKNLSDYTATRVPIMATPPQRPLSSVPKVAIVEKFDCNTLLALNFAGT